jgi:DNA repair photolyase
MTGIPNGPSGSSGRGKSAARKNESRSGRNTRDRGRNNNMPLKKSAGNMYEWVGFTHSHLGGECPHLCGYCYVKRNRFGVAPRYQGEVRLIEDEFKVKYGSGKVIFVEHMNDLFAEGVSDASIRRILDHCEQYPDNEYVFQTKNPSRAALWLSGITPLKYMMGTTLESNRHYPDISKAPRPEDRMAGMRRFKGNAKIFLTIEPILDLDVDVVVGWLAELRPDFVNIGADSKHCHLPEPTPAKVKELVAKLQAAGVVIRKKVNLGRMLA